MSEKPFIHPTTPYQMLGVLQTFAPNGEAQAKCTLIYNEAIKHGADDKDLLRMLVGILVDGVYSEVWPWTPMGKANDEKEV
jgi:hypothetical protein